EERTQDGPVREKAMGVSMDLIQLDGVRKTYKIGGVTIDALAGVSLEIGEQEFVAIMGPSGSGKSTLMHILGCLDSPTSGRYLFKGRDVSSLRSDDLAGIRNRDMGFVFQAYNLLPQMSALENVLLPCSYAAGSVKDGRSKARDLLDRVGLKERMNNRPVEMSGGEQQRVAIARAMMMDPSVILADEPTGNLNSAGAREILNILKELHGAGKTIVYVTHDDAIGAQAQRIIRIFDGRVLADEMNQSQADFGIGGHDLSHGDDIRPSPLSPS
ncbi:MAG: ABC transporter ATP-binding protein, partial [Candidatus Cryosericum sp.]